jgi:hypothetical protein
MIILRGSKWCPACCHNFFFIVYSGSTPVFIVSQGTRPSKIQGLNRCFSGAEDGFTGVEPLFGGWG